MAFFGGYPAGGGSDAWLGVEAQEASEAIQHWLEQRQQAIGIDTVDPLSLGDGSELPTVAKGPYRMEGEFSVDLLNLQGRDGLLKQDITIVELLSSLQRSKEGRVFSWRANGKSSSSPSILFIRWL